jgi:general secretion pathway protein G
MEKTELRKGFTLIEMLIVIAIVGTLSSLVLVGLGPVQRQGRDARRLSDLKQTQTALELYYTKNGAYPTSISWEGLTTAIVGGGIGVKSIPKDPSPARTYRYGSDGTSYVLGAELEDANNPNLKEDVDGLLFGVSCDDASAPPVYCIEF